MEGEWGGYVRIGSVSVRVREGRVGDACCCVGGGGWSSTRGAKNRRETSGAGRLATSVTSCFKPSSALDRLPKLKLAGSADRLSKSTSQPAKKTRNSDKADRLRLLTEKLKSSSPPQKAQPPPSPPPPPSQPLLHTPPDPIFDVKLTKPESRAIIGSYIQRTIPFRSASFSQVDFSSTDGKYIRNARNAALANKAGASLSLPRKKLSEGDQSLSPGSSSTLPPSSNLSIDSAVGSQEWLLPRVEKPLDNKGSGTRSLTHPLGRRGSQDEQLPYSSIDGNGLKSLTTDRVLEGVKEESDTDSAAATSETLSQSVSPAPQHKQWLEFSDHSAVYHLTPSSPPNEANEEYLKDIIEEESSGDGVTLESLLHNQEEKKEWAWSGTEDPQTPEDSNRPQWPKPRPKLTCQSSEEKEEEGKVRVKRCHHLLARTDSLSEGESDCGCRSQTPNRGSPSLFAPSDQSDTEGKHLNRSPHPPRRYSKRPVRGPYGQMLEAEMKKPEAKKFTKHNEELKFLEEFSKPSEIRPRGRTMDDSQLRGSYGGDGPKRKVSANLPYKTTSEQPIVHHQRTTSSPSQLEGCSSNKQPEPSHQLLAHLLKGSSERSLDKPSRLHLLMNSPAHWKDTRTHIVVEIYETERSYVESLQILVMKYLQPLKSSENSSLVDPGVVDEIFYQIPEILAHHKVFLDELHKRLECWDINQSVGDLFLDTFTKQSVIDTYTAFINNWKHAKEAIKSTCQSKPAFARFLETMAREHKGKLALDSLLIMPVQRIPRFELLIQRLIKNTDNSHTDASLLSEAQQAVHELAETINLGQQKALNPRGSNCQELAQLESIIEGLAGLSAPERTFLCHDQVSITTSQGRKDRALFLFNDLLIITSIKRRSGTIRKPSQNVPGSVVSSLEGNKYKLLMKIPLDDLEVVKAKDDSVRKMLKEMEQLTADVSTLSQMAELVTTLHCPHSQMEESIREMLSAINKQLMERHAADSQLSYLELMINTQNGLENIALLFSKPEKRTSWEEIFNEAKQRLAMSGDRRICPELVSAVPIRKTRAGLQFTCAAPTFGPGPKDVWVCNSDGYVGQVCVLSLHPEPTVTSCNGVCNARILCISPVPGQSANGTHSNYDCNSGISISVEDTDKSATNIQLDSYLCFPFGSSSSSEEEEREEEGDLASSEETMAGTMWLGTEDGCIHVYNCTDNIRTKKNKVKIQHTSPVHTIIYLDNKVFVSLANGDITRYLRESSGVWNTNDAVTVSVGSAAMPVTKMVPIGGRLWCSCNTSVKVLNTSSLQIEHSFVASGETGRAITAIAVSGFSVWISLHNSAVIRLFHASTYEWLGEVNVAPAVTKMLASCDDIIRQHKAACLRVTSLLACKDLLWIGTSAGVILTMPLPHISQTTTKITTSLNALGVPHGHTGHVRFLTTVDMTHPVERGKPERRKLLVISGGDGYEDFRAAGVSEVAGREDSTNHLLLWNV